MSSFKNMQDKQAAKYDDMVLDYCLEARLDQMNGALVCDSDKILYVQ